MILFDFKGYRADDEVIATLKEYRNIPSLGRGNHNRYPFTVAYFYQDENGELRRKTRRIRVKRRLGSLTQDKDIIEEFKVISQRGLIATEFDVESDKYIQEYEVEIRVKGNELTIEYRDNEGDYHQYKGIETSEPDTYELTSTENPANKAKVSLFIDEEKFLSIEGDLIEDNHKKQWIIERKEDDSNI